MSSTDLQASLEAVAAIGGRPNPRHVAEYVKQIVQRRRDAEAERAREREEREDRWRRIREEAR